MSTNLQDWFPRTLWGLFCGLALFGCGQHVDSLDSAQLEGLPRGAGEPAAGAAGSASMPMAAFGGEPESASEALSVQITASAMVVCPGECVLLDASVSGGTPPHAYRWTPAVGEGPGPHRFCPAHDEDVEVTVTEPARGTGEFATSGSSTTARLTLTVDAACESTGPPDAQPPAPDAGPDGGAGGVGEPAVVALSAGDLHTCAVLAGGSVKCWGNDEHGELGFEQARTRGDEPGEMGAELPVVDLGTGLRARALSTSLYNSCALFDDGRTKCWGYSADTVPGAITNSSNLVLMGDALPFVPLPRTPTMTSGSGTHVCAVLGDGTLRCWGRDSGAGDDQHQIVHDFGEAARVRQLALDGHACALFDGGGIRCWGHNQAGELGLGDVTARPNWEGQAPTVDLGTGASAVAVAVGGTHTCAVLDDGAVKCWGANYFGQLGVGDQDLRGDQPFEMGDALRSVPLGLGRHAIAITLGGGFSCALLDNHELKCWGNNEYGQLGQGHTRALGDDPFELGDALPPIELGPGRKVTAVDAGRDFVCATLDAAELKCWGRNHRGQLGQGHAEDIGDEPGEMGAALPVVDLGAPLLQ